TGAGAGRSRARGRQHRAAAMAGSRPMKVLCTTSRMPFAVDEIRKLGEAGHAVYAADTFHNAPGSHSAGVTERVLVPKPKQETLEFVGAVADLCLSKGIDLLVPMFEEVFYLSKHREQLESLTQPFFPEFDVMHRLHDK